MTEQERFDKNIKKYPHPHIGFYARPHSTRRHFFQVLGAGVSGYFLTGPWGPTEARAQGSVEPKGTAKQAIFIFLAGAPSHVDLFDFKEVPGVTVSSPICARRK